MVDCEFFWDPICPWAWVASRWVTNVQAEVPVDIDWRFLALRILNEDKDYETEFPPGYERRHQRGLELLRVAAAVQEESGREAVLPYYTAVGRRIHVQRDGEAFDDPAEIAAVLRALGQPADLALAATDSRYDAVIRADTEEALARCGGAIGTPVLSFAAPDGPSFFGPVINRAPKGQEAVELWECVAALARNPHFSELKRAHRDKPVLE